MRKLIMVAITLLSLNCYGQVATRIQSPNYITNQSGVTPDANFCWIEQDVVGGVPGWIRNSSLDSLKLKLLNIPGLRDSLLNRYDKHQVDSIISIIFDWGMARATAEAEIASINSDLHGNYWTKTQADLRFLQSFTEIDPVFSASVAHAITGTNVTNWNTAFGWGNHAVAGYLTGINSAQVIAALGFTPYPNTNPNSYINQAGARSAISVTGGGSYNSSTGVITISNTGTVTSVGVTSTDLVVGGSPVTTSGNITVNLPNVGTAGSYGYVTTDSKGRVISGKRLEPYSGTTNASGNYTVTFATPYSVIPNVQASISNQSNVQHQIRVAAVSTTGFTVNVNSRNTAFLSLLGLDILTSGTTNVSGATVQVLVTEM